MKTRKKKYKEGYYYFLHMGDKHSYKNTVPKTTINKHLGIKKKRKRKTREEKLALKSKMTKLAKLSAAKRRRKRTNVLITNNKNCNDSDISDEELIVTVR